MTNVCILGVSLEPTGPLEKFEGAESIAVIYAVEENKNWESFANDITQKRISVTRPLH